MRTEKDSLGTLEIEDDVYYGIQTHRALSHFPLTSGGRFPLEVYHAMITVKLAAFRAMYENGFLESDKANALIQAAEEALTGGLDKHFVIPVVQGGAGTSVHMNVNEVLTNRALEILGYTRGDYKHLNPNDHTNRFQSTNDVFPTSVKIAAFELLEKLERELATLQTELQKKEQQYADILKPGRTQFQEAVPITVGQEFGAWAESFARDRWRVFKMMERIRQINLGGTAIGTGINAPKLFIFKWTEEVRKITGMGFASAENKIDNTQNADLFVEVSGILKTLASNLIKIGNDLRLLSSGPYAGFSELILPAVQPGSSIMPGKVNPVIAEFAVSCGIEIQAHDMAISTAANLGSLELNAFVPTIGYHLILALQNALNGVSRLSEDCIRNIKINLPKIQENLSKSRCLATLLTPYIGYANVAELLHKTSTEQEFRKAVVNQTHLTNEDLKIIFKPRKATSPGIAGSDLLSEKIKFGRKIDE